jgi:hypothetical protein
MRSGLALTIHPSPTTLSMFAVPAARRIHCRDGHSTTCPLGGSGAILDTGTLAGKGSLQRDSLLLHTDSQPAQQDTNTSALLLWRQDSWRRDAPEMRPDLQTSGIDAARGDKEVTVQRRLERGPMTWSQDDAARILGSPLGKLRCRGRTGTGTRWPAVDDRRSFAPGHTGLAAQQHLRGAEKRTQTWCE